ncbi:MAG: PUA domain-containing protein [Candidatus Bathyarchaeia archaeon]|jgi:PUA domain protein
MRRLKDKEVKGLLREFIGRYPGTEGSLASVESFDELAVGEEMVYFADNLPLILRRKIGLLPSLKFDKCVQSLPRVVVDMGAVAHVANGADIMRPGIRDIPSNFAKGDLLVVLDEKYDKPLALGLAEVESTEMKSMTKGKVIKNVHFVGDELWTSYNKPS